MNRVDKQLLNSKEVIKAVLTDQPKTRNSYSFLELAVLKVYAKQRGLSTHDMSVDTLFMNRDKWKFPKAETIRRNCQLIQAKYPELAADEEISAHRLLNQERVREYVRGAKYEA